MTYQSELNRHLAEYKRTVLGISEAGLYRYRGVDLPYEHILQFVTAAGTCWQKLNLSQNAF